MDTHLIAVAALVFATVALWASGKLPEYLTGLLFFAVATVFALAPPAAIFSGFASTAFWLVLSGYVMGLAIVRTGLAARAARLLAGPMLGSYPLMIGGVLLLTYGLAFVMPSNMGRIALLMPIVMALADEAGLPAGRAGRHGLALAVGFGTLQMSASILPANVPNLVMVGAIESAYGLHLAYMPYLLLHGPVLGLGKGLLIGGLIVWMFRDRTAPAPGPRAALPPMSADEKRLAVLLSVTLGFWLTDSLHGVSAAWIGLASACFCLLPRVGFVTGDQFGREVNHRTAFYVASILGLANLVSQSGLGTFIGDALLHAAPLTPGQPFANFVTLSGVTVALNAILTTNGVPALFTPLARSFAEASGLPLMTVLMIQVMTFATPLLPYQASPIIVAMEMGHVPLKAGVRLGLVVALGTFLILLPLDYLWFSVLGYIPR